MKILLLEDTYSIFGALKDKLLEDGHIVFKATQISDAIDILNEESVDVFIIDLRVKPIGLTEKEIKQLPNGRFSGWVFLDNYVFKKDINYKSKTILYSEYIGELKSKVDLSLYPEIKVMSKQDSSIEDVRNYVKSLKSKPQ
ncbi:MAG: response regulator [Prolixibacteraceae bacterium]|nr:response regulator [Prolixibacteraceae bacterium]